MATEHDHATSLGETGGLPGTHAVAAASHPTSDDVIAPPGNRPTSTTDADSHDDGRGREGDAYDEPDDISTPAGEELNDSPDSFGQGDEAPDGPAQGAQFAG